MKLCINSRHEIRLIELEEVAYLKADGNYSDFHFANGAVRSELSCLSDFEQAITRQYETGGCPFVRLGRSLFINTDYIASVNIQKQMLSFNSDKVPPISLSKPAAKELKLLLVQKHEILLSSSET